jgi:cytochrome c
MHPIERAMRIPSAITLALAAAWLLLQDAAAAPLSPSAQRGLTFVKANCSRCHAIDKVSASPLKIAPPFRDLHLRYPVENLREAFAEGIRTGHPTMPEFRLDPGQIDDLIAYLKTLEH